jgi:nitrogenase molybdenum-iron protein alpha chain
MASANNKPRPDPEDVKKAMLEKYPAKVAKKRAKQIVVNRAPDDGERVPEILSNTRTTPGVIT